MKRGREMIFHDKKLNEALHKDIEEKRHAIENIEGVKMNKKVKVDYRKDLVKVHHTETDEIYLYDYKNRSVENINSKLKPLNRMRLIKIGRNKMKEFMLTANRDILRGIYRHFKGKLYAVKDIVVDMEGNIYVLYQELYGEMLTYIRPYEMFASEVDREKYPLEKQKYRFEPFNNIHSQLNHFYIIINDVTKANVELNKLSKYLYNLFDGLLFSIQYFGEDERIVVTIKYYKIQYYDLKDRLENLKTDISNIIDTSVIYYSSEVQYNKRKDGKYGSYKPLG